MYTLKYKVVPQMTQIFWHQMSPCISIFQLISFLGFNKNFLASWKIVLLLFQLWVYMYLKKETSKKNDMNFLSFDTLTHNFDSNFFHYYFTFPRRGMAKTLQIPTPIFLYTIPSQTCGPSTLLLHVVFKIIFCTEVVYSV